MEATEKTLTAQNPEIIKYIIKVDGNEISKEHQVVSIKTEMGVNKIPKATIVINDGEPSIEDFKVSSSGDFKPGRKIEIQLGHQNSKSENVKIVFSGIIIKNSHRINNHCSELTIDCKHEAEKMTLSKTNGHFSDKLDSDIVKEILQSNKFNDAEVVDSVIPQPQLMNANNTDWDFIISRLDVCGMHCLINDDKIKIKAIPEKSSQLDTDTKKDKLPDEGTFTLTYGKNILEFNCDMDARVQSTAVKTVTWDFKSQSLRTVENEEVQEEETNDSNKMSASNLGKVANEPLVLSSSANMSQQSQQAIANAKKQRQRFSRIKGTVKYSGTTVTAPGDFVLLKGLGDNFNGRAFVSNIVHDYTDADWITEATLGWDERFFTEQTNPTHAASAFGQSSSLQGLHIGIVTSIEDDDGEYRVKVKLPLVSEGEDGIYARVATLDAGSNRGTFFRPEIDDEVVLGFMNDDPSSPVILGMLHSSAKSSPLEPESSNDKKGYVSRSSIKLIFDDGENSIKIETPGSRVFEMNDNSGIISLKDGNGNKITMEQTGITIEAAVNLTLKAGAMLSIAAPQVSFVSDGSMSIEGKGSASLKAGGLMEISGSMVKIN